MTDPELTNAVLRIEAHPHYANRPTRETKVDPLGYGAWVPDYARNRESGLDHEPAIRATENAICTVAGLPLMWPPEPTPLLSRLAVKDGRLHDGTAYLGWRGVSEFDAIHRVRHAMTKDIERRFDRAAANGCNGVRVFGMARNLFDLHPAMLSYWDALEVVVLFANARGLYVEFCLFADAQMVMPRHVDRVQFTLDMAKFCKGRPGVIAQLANEPRKNGWAEADDPALFDLAHVFKSVAPDVLLSIGDPADYVKKGEEPEPLQGRLARLAKASDILVLHGERKSQDSRYAGWVDHLKGFHGVYSNPLRRYRIHDEPMGAAGVSIDSKRDHRPGAHRAAALVCAVMGIGFTYHYISAQDDATPGMDGQKFAAMIPQTPDFHFRNAGTTGSCVDAFKGWDKVRTCDNGREGWAVAYGPPEQASERRITWASGWRHDYTVAVDPDVHLYRAVKE